MRITRGRWIIIGLLAASGFGYYWYKKQPVTTLEPGNSYKLSGQLMYLAAYRGLLTAAGTTLVANADGTGVLTGPYAGSAPAAVPQNIVATQA